MTATPPQPLAHTPPPQRWTAGRIVALVVGIVLLLPAVGLLVGGGTLLWADRSQRTDGYLFSGSEAFSSGGFALTSEEVQLSTGADWLPVSSALGTARLEATGSDPARAVFVGIAPVAEGNAYLSGVQRTVVNDFGDGTGTTGQRALAGGAPAGPPGDQQFWVAKASGPGTQQLSWSPTQGNWMVIVMNADGSAGVSVQARIGATVPGLSGLAWGLLGTGLLLGIAGILLIVLAARRPAQAPTAGLPAGSAGVPPSWAPPSPRAAAETTGADDTARVSPPAAEQPRP